MEMIQHVVVAVEDASQSGEARRAAAAVAERVGLDAATTSNVAIVVTEAATNLVKHARAGEVLISATRDGGARGIDVLTVDAGPGIANLARAMADGMSTAGSPGTGLGAIRRLSTEFDIYSATGGTALLSRVAEPAVAARRPEVVVGVVCVNFPGEEMCGDGWAVVHAPMRSVVLVVDGLGHGAGAAEAAREATRIFHQHTRLAGAEILQRIHDGLRATRGAAAAIAELDRERRIVRFAGIGNIAGVVLEGEHSRNMVSHHGILGHQVRKIQEFTYPWPVGALVVLHSDGLSTRWNLASYPGLSDRHPMLTAGVLYRDFRRKTDDATVVVLREAA